MKKLLITSFALAVLAIGGGVFVRTALVQSDPVLEANVEALSRAESGGGILCLKNPIPGDKWYHNCSTCRPDSYSVSTMAFCYR